MPFFKSMQTFILTGKVIRNAEVRVYGDQKQMLKFPVAITESKRASDGEGWEYSNSFFDVTYFGNGVNLDRRAKLLGKGAIVTVIGKISQHKADDGRVYWDVIADDVQVLVPTGDAGSDAEPEPQEQAPAPAPRRNSYHRQNQVRRSARQESQQSAPQGDDGQYF